LVLQLSIVSRLGWMSGAVRGGQVVRASRPPENRLAVATLLRSEFVYHKRLMMHGDAALGLRAWTRLGLRVVKPVLSGVEGVPPREAPIACHAEAVCEGRSIL